MIERRYSPILIDEKTTLKELINLTLKTKLISNLRTELLRWCSSMMGRTELLRWPDGGPGCAALAVPLLLVLGAVLPYGLSDGGKELWWHGWGLAAVWGGGALAHGGWWRICNNDGGNTRKRRKLGCHGGT